MKLSDIKAKTASSSTTTATKLIPGRAIGIIRGVVDISPQRVYGTQDIEDAVAIVVDIQGQDLCKKVSLNMGYGSGLSKLLGAAGVDPDDENASLGDLVDKPLALELFENIKGLMTFQSNQVEPLDENDKAPMLTKSTFYFEDAAKLTAQELNKLPNEVKFLFQNRVRVRSPK